MSKWQVRSQQADQYSVNKDSNDRMQQRTMTRDGGGSGNYTKSTYSVVGINASNAKSAADSMVASTKKVMDKINEIKMDNTLLNGAVKGEEIQTALTNYLDKVKLYCAAVVSDINAFADKLYEVSRVWEESQKTYAQETIEDSANTSFSGSTTDEYRTQEATGSGA